MAQPGQSEDVLQVVPGQPGQRSSHHVSEHDDSQLARGHAHPRPNDATELRYTDRRRIHNLKYFTWIEQQGRTVEELLAQWSDTDYWTGVQQQVSEIDALIDEFNQNVGLM